MSAVFYKKFWHLIGERVKQEILAMVNEGSMPEGWNDKLIVLIPKLKDPKKLKELRPISLCMVFYELISKVVTSRLKVVLPDIISASQSAFVPGRMITDNVFLAYDLTNFLKQKYGINHDRHEQSVRPD